MDKTEWDHLYHYLRRVAVGTDEEKFALVGLSSHMAVSGGNYPGLVNYLDYYGKQYILGPVIRVLCEKGWPIGGFIDLGGGTGWLGRGLGNAFGLHWTNVDKRDWPGVDLQLDLEVPLHYSEFLKNLKSGDVLVACEFFHCLEYPGDFLVALINTALPLLVVEYYSVCDEHNDSYTEQVGSLCKLPYKPGGFRDLLIKTSWKYEVYDYAEPYMIYAIDPREQ